MRDIPATGGLAHLLRATVSGDGSPGPIEERIGRKLVRLMDPGSEEGERLLQSGLVELVGPGGEKLGRIRMEEAWRRLICRLEEQLESSDTPDEELVREGLDRLRSLAATAERN